MHKVLKAILEGVYDPGSYFHALQGKPHITQMIWNMVKNKWKNHIKLPAYCFYTVGDCEYVYENIDIPGKHSFYRECFFTADFPAPSSINIDMMPFIVSNKFKDTKLPKYTMPYFTMIQKALFGVSGFNPISIERFIGHTRLGKVFYLTIKEKRLDTNTIQCRLHTENCAPFLTTKIYQTSYDDNDANNVSDAISVDYDRGIYLACNVRNMCTVWNCNIEADKESGQEVIGNHGDVEHLKPLLPKIVSEVLPATTMCWLSDRTPYELTPLQTSTICQLIKINSDKTIKNWFTEDYTANPNGILPDLAKTKIIKGSRFSGSSSEVVEQLHKRRCSIQ